MVEDASVWFGPFRLDLANQNMWRGQEACKLTRKAWAVLRYLIEHPGQLVTKEALFAAVWPEVVVGDAALTVCIRELRQALGDDAKAPQYIETLYGRGYRFIAAVTAASVPSSEFRVPSFPPPPAPNTQTPVLVGRDAELTQLHKSLDKTLTGERQVVFVTGEPGIGKTALLQGLESRVQGLESENQNPAFFSGQTLDARRQTLDAGVRLGWGQCIEHHGSGEAFLPILDALGRLCRSLDGAHLMEILRRHAPMWLVQLPAVIEPEELESLQRKVQGASRERMLRELAEALEVLTTDTPLILILEDLHWSDVSTFDLLSFMARRKEPARLLVIGAYRPVEMLGDGHPLKGITQELYGHQLAAELSLGVLSEADIETYLATRLAEKPSRDREGAGRRTEIETENRTNQPLADARGSDSCHALAHVLYRRTGGNPLFLVSLVNDLVARGALTQTAEGWTLQEEIDIVSIPDSIRQLVARQRERLQPEAQRLLEAASVAGMEFSAAAVAAALGSETVVIEQRCERLAERQHFLRRVGVEEWPDGTLAARYSFLHALYQQLWHERVSPTQLQHYHLQVGERKEQAYGERVREIAAELAVHFEQGRNFCKTVRYLQIAGTNAIQRSGNQEAIKLLRRGLEVLEDLPDTPERVQQELTLQIALSKSLMATKGNADSEVEGTFARVRELYQQVGESPQLFDILFGLCVFYLNRAKHETAYELAEQCLGLAQSTQDSYSLAWAHCLVGMTLFNLGEFSPAREHFKQGIAFYDRLRHGALASRTGADPGTVILSMTALALWSLGYPDQALQRSQEALTLAQEVSHPLSLANTLMSGAALHLLRREGKTIQERIDALVVLSDEQGFALYSAYGPILRGWALTEQRKEEEGVEQVRQGIAAWQGTGAELWRPYYLALLAESYGNVGRTEEGVAVVASALAQVNKTGERWYEAELYRLKGELTLQLWKVASQKSEVSNTSPPTPDSLSSALNTEHLTPDTQAEAEAEACFLK